MGPKAFLGRSGVCTFLALAGDDGYVHCLLLQAVDSNLLLQYTLAVVQVQQGFSFTDWDEGTLDEAGCYTPQSDTYQIGVMLLKCQHLSPAGLSFACKLKSKAVSAADAAKDPYFGS